MLNSLTYIFAAKLNSFNLVFFFFSYDFWDQHDSANHQILIPLISFSIVLYKSLSVKIALGECGSCTPTLTVIEKSPKWSPTQSRKKQHESLFTSDASLTSVWLRYLLSLFIFSFNFHFIDSYIGGKWFPAEILFSLCSSFSNIRLLGVREITI